jgi:hypothetical protein
LNYDQTYDANVIALPYDFMFVYDPAIGTGPIIPPGGKRIPENLNVRSNFLQDILLFFGHIGTTPGIVDVPETGVFTVRNYPNPFNPATRIEYNMPRRGELTIRIFNVRGELVKTVIDEVVPAGAGHFEWDGTDAKGSAVASGVYFYESVALGESKIGKMALIK